MSETRVGRALVYVLPVMLLACMAVGAALFWLNQRSPAVYVGRLSDFPPSADPYYVPVDNQMLFVVVTGTEVLVLEPQFASSNPHWQCDVKWLPTNGRFEDPCSGAKFTLTGGWIVVHGLVADGLEHRDLRRYPVEVRRDKLRGDELWLTALTPRPGRLVTTAGPAE